MYVTNLTKGLQHAIERAIKNGDTQHAIAKRAGVSAIVLSRFRRGERSIHLETTEKLIEALGLKVAISERGKQ